MTEPTQHIDDELQSLLDDLENDEIGTVPDIISGTTDTTIITIPDPELSDPAVDSEQTELQDLPIESTPAGLVDISEIVSKFDHDYGEVQANLKKDRAKIDTVINILLQRVTANADAETDTMSLVKALGVLSDTNGHAVKLLDSRSKLLSATKTSINANQTNVNINGSDADLMEILSQPASGDE